MSSTAATLLCLALAAPAGADPVAPLEPAEPSTAVGASPYQLDPFADTAATIGLAAAFVAANMVRVERPFAPQCAADGPDRCDPADLFGVDRYAVGKKSNAWLLASDIAQFSGIFLPFLLDGIDVARSDGGTLVAWATDAVVILEAELVAGLMVQFLKVSTNRPRPRQYEPRRYRAVPGSQDSFASGHAVATTTGLTALAVTWWWRHSDSPSRFWVAGAVAAFALAGSWARVESGNHFPSDVIAGVALGALGGTLIPWLHRAVGDGQAQLVPIVGERPGAALLLRF